MSLEASPRRHRSNFASDFQSVVADASEIDPLVGVIDSQDSPDTSRELERNTPVLSRVLFHSEDIIEVEELQESLLTPNYPLPPDHLDVLLYIGTPTNGPLNPSLYRSFPLMTTAGSMASTMSATSMQTPISVQGGGTISIPSVTPSTAIFDSTSIPSSSGSTQAFSFGIGFFPFGKSPSTISSVPLSIPSTASTSMTSMASGSTSFQGFPFGGGHIPHSNPSLGSIPFPSMDQSYNPFQGWTNPAVSGLGALFWSIGEYVVLFC